MDVLFCSADTLSLSQPHTHTHPDRASKLGCKAGGVVMGAGRQQMSFCNERFILAPFTAHQAPARVPLDVI